MRSKKWTKIVALFLAVIGMAACLASCGKNGSSGKVPKEFQGRLMEQYMKLICSNNYTFESSPVKGGKSSTNIFYAKNKAGNEMVTFQVKSGKQSVPASIMYVVDEKNKDSGQYYVVFSSEGIYAPVPPNDQKAVNSYASALEKLSMDYLMSDSFVGSGKVQYQGQTYSYEDYANASRGVRNRFLFDADDNLKMMGKVDASGKVSGLAVISIYETNDTTFSDVYNYRAVDYYTIFPGDAKTSKTASALQ